MEAWQKIISNTQNFESFSVIFVCFLPLLVCFCHTFLFFYPVFACFSAIYLPMCPFAEQFGRIAWYCCLAEHMAPLAGRNFGWKGMNFGRILLLAPPKKCPMFNCKTSYLICYLLTYFNFFLGRPGHLQLEATWHQEGPHHSC